MTKQAIQQGILGSDLARENVSHREESISLEE